MTALRLLAMLIGLAASLPAAAQVGPSFDCGRAALVDERLICSDPTLRQADQDVAVLYRRVLEARQGARREELRLDQRNWLLQRNKDCGVHKTTKIAEADRLDYVHCFLDAYAERKDDLAAIANAPEDAPTGVSAPIRKSLFRNRPPDSGAEAARLRSSGIELPPMAGWESMSWLDGRLYVGPPRRVTWSIDTGEVVPSDAAIPAAAETDRRIVVAPDGAAALDLGPKEMTSSGEERSVEFVAIRRGDGAFQRVEPPIRIDTRFPLDARYSAVDATFIVYPARLPRVAAMRAAGQRRWAKTDCSIFWAVSLRTGASETRCIPYGPYYQNAPIPLPTRSGLYFATVGKTATADDGLYLAGGGETERVVAGRIAFPSVSPDGCRIAFGLEKPDATGKPPVVSAWDACAR